MLFADKGQIVMEKLIFKLNDDRLSVNIIADPDCLICEARTEEFIKSTGYSFKDLLNRSDILESMKSVPLFRSLSQNKLESIVNKIRIENFNDGDNIITQGEEGSKLYIIKQGKANVIIENRYSRTLHENDNFGEKALFFKEPRSATIKALGYCECLVVSCE